MVLGCMNISGKKSKTKVNIFQAHLSDYDKTYDIPKFILKLVGLHTMEDNSDMKKKWFSNIFYWFEFLNLFFATWLELINMYETAKGGSFQDAIEIFRMMPCVGYLIMALSKSYKMVIYRPVYENIASELRNMWPRGNISEEEFEIITRSLEQLNLMTKAYYWCNNALLVFFLSPPFVEICKRWLGYDVPLILPFFYWFPFDPFQDIYYEFILIFQTWHGLITIWFMLSSDLIFCIFISHISTLFDLLSVTINHLIYVPIDTQLIPGYPLSKGIMEKPNLDFEVWEKDHLKELIVIVDKHRTLIRLSEDVEKLFSLNLLINFVNSTVVICFCGFCSIVVEKFNEMVYKAFLATSLTQTWLLCWYGQRLLESSEGVADALYNSGWYLASKKIKSSMFIIFARAQKNVCVSTYGFSVLSLRSYSMILKTSWSYFTLLLNVYKK